MVTQSPFSIYVLNIFDVGNWVVGFCYGLLALGFVVSASLLARYFEGRAARDILGGMCLVIAGCVVVTGLTGATRSIFVFTTMYFIWGVLLGASRYVTWLCSTTAAADISGATADWRRSWLAVASLISKDKLAPNE